MGKHRSTEIPYFQTLLNRLTTMNMSLGEPISDYLTGAEILKLNLEEAGEKTSGTIFTAMVLKGQSAADESHVCISNIGILNQINDTSQHFVNFANTR